MKRKNLSRTAFVAALAIGLGGCSGGLFGGGGDKKVTPKIVSIRVVNTLIFKS